MSPTKDPNALWAHIRRRTEQLEPRERLEHRRQVIAEELFQLLQGLMFPCPHAGEPGHPVCAIPPVLQPRVRAALDEYGRQMEDYREYLASLADKGERLAREMQALLDGNVESTETRDLIDLGRLGELVELLPNLPQRPDPYGWHDVQAAIAELAQGKPVDEARELRLRESYEAQVKRIREDATIAQESLDVVVDTARLVLDKAGPLLALLAMSPSEQRALIEALTALQETLQSLPCDECGGKDGQHDGECSVVHDKFTEEA